MNNLNNQGLSEVTVTSGTAKYKAGKIGQGFDLNSKVMFNCPDLSGCKKFTICFWAKIEDDANITVNWQDIIGFTTQKADNSDTGQLRSESCYGSVTATDNLRYIHWHDNGTYAFSNFTVCHTANGDTQRNVWHHCVLAMDSENGIWAYTDGNPITVSGGTVMNGGHLTGQFWLGETDKIQGVINDVRVYKDEILSPKVIKEISKGLVLHYPLNRGGFGQDNISANSGDLTKWNKESGITCTWDSDKQMYKIQSTSTSSRWGIWQQVSCEPNTTYTFSVDGMKTDQNMYLSVGSMAAGAWPSNHGAFTTKRNRLSYTWTTGSDHTIIRMYLAIYPTADGSKTGYYALPKLELGSIATPWTPNSADPLYSAMGLNSNVEYDVSGYQNNGSIIGALTCSSDTPRYMVSTYFNGGDNAITVPFNSVISDATIPFTINLWFKKSELGTDNYESLFGGPSGFEMDTRSGNATSLSLYMTSTRGGAVYSPFNLNEWYMVTMASDRTNEYYYVNGELSKTITAKSMPVGNYFIGAWQVYNEQNYKGLISDFRIYSTCLSADDILALYHTPASIANNGTLLTQGEISEV